MYQTKQQSLKETMNLAELGTMEILENITDHEEPSLESLEQVVYEDTSLVENLELEERNGDDMAAARPSGYNKTENDDAVGA
ncbi:MAG: RNA polymerase sigma factor, RpoD/SigA family, partial [Dolichospermum sp.]